MKVYNLKLTENEIYHIHAILKLIESDYIIKLDTLYDDDDFSKKITSELLSDTQSILKKIQNLYKEFTL